MFKTWTILLKRLEMVEDVVITWFEIFRGHNLKISKSQNQKFVNIQCSFSFRECTYHLWRITSNSFIPLAYEIFWVFFQKFLKDSSTSYVTSFISRETVSMRQSTWEVGRKERLFHNFLLWSRFTWWYKIYNINGLYQIYICTNMRYDMRVTEWVSLRKNYI